MRKTRLTTLLRLFVIFFKAGTFTFAGGLAMLPVIEKDVVDRYALLSKDDFLEYATLAQTLPGIIALNCACFVGKSAAGLAGMLVAALGSTVSAFALMLAATLAIRLIPDSGPWVGAMRAVRAASSALILSAAFSLGRHNLKSAFAVVVMLVSMSLVLFLRVSVPLIIVAAAIAGYVYGRVTRRARDQNGGGS